MNDTPILPIASFPDLSLAKITNNQGERLPRWEAQGAVYDLSFHLADSVPSEQLAIWREKREQLQIVLSDPSGSETAKAACRSEMSEVYNEHVERYLAAGHGECLLRDRVAAEAVAQVLEHDNGRLYALHAYTIMPNHLHIIVGGFNDTTLMKATIDQWKRISAHAVNRVLGRSGDVWRRDAFTRIIRDRDEYVAKLKYAWNNPEAAGLSDGFLRKRFV